LVRGCGVGVLDGGKLPCDQCAGDQEHGADEQHGPALRAETLGDVKTHLWLLGEQALTELPLSIVERE
jgi:hypothetical protein